MFINDTGCGSTFAEYWGGCPAFDERPLTSKTSCLTCWKEWSWAMEDHLESMGVWHVLGLTEHAGERLESRATLVPPRKDQELFEPPLFGTIDDRRTLEFDDKRARTVLVHAVADKRGLQSFSTACELWQHLEKKHKPQGPEVRWKAVYRYDDLKYRRGGSVRRFSEIFQDALEEARFMGWEIDDEAAIRHLLRLLEDSYPEWVEIQRGYQRSCRIQKVEVLSFLQMKATLQSDLVPRFPHRESSPSANSERRQGRWANRSHRLRHQCSG